MAIQLDIEFNFNRSRILRLGETLKDLADFNAEAATVMEAGVKEYYAREAGPDGAWAALAPSTVAQKGSGAILRRTGAMINAITSDYDNSSARVQNSTSYAIFSQTGTSRQPQRKHIGFSPEMEAELRRLFAAYVRNLI